MKNPKNRKLSKIVKKSENLKRSQNIQKKSIFSQNLKIFRIFFFYRLASNIPKFQKG